MDASGSVTERHETPLSGHGVPIAGDLREAAVALLQDIAAGSEIDVERVRGLARAVLGSDVVRTAQRVLDAETAFVLRRGIELAAVLITPIATAAVGARAAGSDKETAG